MDKYLSPRTTGTKKALMALSTVAISAAPAHARPQFLPPEDFSLDTLLSDPFGLAIGALLLVVFVAGGWFVLHRAPTTAELERRRETFLGKLPSDSKGYKAVLYLNDVAGWQGAAGQMFHPRIIVELVHEKREKTKTLYRFEGTPSIHKAMDRPASEEAFDIWLGAAREYQLPAICATRKGIQMLEARHYAELESAREIFQKKLHSRMWVNARNPLR